jgi:ABC-type transport system substrate-binding protein
VYFGNAIPAALPVVGQRMPFYNPRFTPLPSDVARARQLLAEAGHGGGLVFEFLAGTNNRDLAVLLVSYWQRAGIKANLNLMDPVSLSRAWWQRTLQGDQVLLVNGLANGIASAVYLNSKSQVAMFASPATDDLYRQGTAIIDPAREEAWMRDTLLPALDEIFPIPAVLEFQEGVFGIGPKVKSWDRFDLHGFGLQWLVPAK